VAAPQVVVESGPDPGKFGHKVTCQLTGGEVGMISSPVAVELWPIQLIVTDGDVADVPLADWLNRVCSSRGCTIMSGMLAWLGVGVTYAVVLRAVALRSGRGLKRCD
jgi:hypothetical protein